MLENPAAELPVQIPNGRHHFGPVADEELARVRRMDLAPLAQTVHDAVEIALALVRHIQPHRHVLAQDARERHRVVGLGQHRQHHAKRPGNPLADGELLQQQLVLSKLVASDGDRPVVLRHISHEESPRAKWQCEQVAAAMEMSTAA